MKRIRNMQKTLQVFNLPSRSLHLPGRGSGDRAIAEVTEAELESPELQKAYAKKWIRIERDKTKPVASPTQPVAGVEPNTSSDNK